MNNSKQVLIVGAGPVGLVLAAFLAKHEVPFKIIDQRSGPVKESRALGVHARTLELLRPLGLDQVFIQRGRITREMHFHNVRKKLFSLSFDCLNDHTPYPYYLILPQTTTERILLRYLASQRVEVEWNVLLEDFTQNENSVICTLTSGEGKSEETFRFLAGCDGANSYVRRHLNIDFSGKTYEALFSLAEVEIAENSIETNATHVYMAEKTACAVIPMPCGKYRIVGPNPDPAGTSDFTHFQHFLDSQSLFTDLTIHSAGRIVDYKMHKRVASQFSKDNVFICGDAAHIHSPAGGQGMNTGMQDAINLAWKLAGVIKGTFPERLLSTYNIERRAIARDVVENTDKAMRFVSERSIKSKFLSHIIYPIILQWFKPVKLMAAMAQLTTGYSKSKTPWIGSRFPWFKLSQNDTSLDLFDGKNWTLLSFCETPSQVATFYQSRTILDGNLQHIIVSDDRYFKDQRPSNHIEKLYSSQIPKDWQNQTVLVRPDGYIHAIAPINDEEKIVHAIKRLL